jgi:hypothetical protein
VAASNLSTPCNISPSVFAARRKDASLEDGKMEIAAVMMLAAVIFGICLQFDRQG